ncbi:MAG: glycosyltransferase family 39 protein, partial [Massilia sp.]|nr:glycosyltransferase family 39 protein [Massilia sp.]
MIGALMHASRAWRWELVLAFGTVCGALYLLWRNAGLPPMVFGDELTYSTFSRLVRLEDASVPSYLYLWLARGSSSCGAGFLDCVRVANALLFAAATPFVYLVARRVCAAPLAAGVALAALLAPANSYSAYFMPEAPYYFGFALLAWTSLATRERGWLRYALATGAILGIMTLIKVHAIFLLPAQCLFVLATRRHAVREALSTAALTLALALAIRLGLGYALAGDAGLQLFGPMYGAHAEGSPDQLALLLSGAFANLRGHLMGLALLLPFPLCLLCHALLGKRAADSCSSRTQPLGELQLYAALMLAAPLAMAVAYTATIFAIEGTRVHMRYYDFAFPLLFVVGAAAGSAGPRARLPAAVLALVAAAAMLYASAALTPAFRLTYVDCAELASVLASRPMLQVLLGLQVLTLSAWVVSARLGGMLFVFGVLPWFALQGALATRDNFARTAHPSIYDAAGQFARANLSAAERTQLSIAGDGASNLMRAKFHADEHRIKLIELADNAPLEQRELPPSGQWLLVVGPHRLAPPLTPAVQRPDFALVRLAGQPVRLWQVNLSGAEADLAMARKVSGFGISEQWGRWSTGKHATLEFTRPLPRELVLTIHARAFGPNAGQPFLLNIGGQQAQFTLGQEAGDITLRFNTDGRQSRITIVVPQPVSPRQLGVNPDRRTLGIGLHSVMVATPM